MNELVVGVDGSVESFSALRWAAALGEALEAKVVVVEAWSQGDPAAADQTAAELERELAATADRALGERAAGLDIEFVALRGSAVGEILDRVTPDGGLVLGSRGRGGFAGLMLGSVSRALIEHAPCPVMVVRQDHAVPHPGEAILVGLDGSPTSQRALQWAAGIARATGAAVTAAHVWQAGKSEVRPRLHRRLASTASRSVAGWAGATSPPARPMEREGDPRLELVKLAEQLDAGLLVVGRRGQGPVKALRLGSVASYLVTSSPVPIAVIPPGPDAEPD